MMRQLLTFASIAALLALVAVAAEAQTGMPTPVITYGGGGGSSGGAPSGPAGGDLSGTYPNPTVTNLSHANLFSSTVQGAVPASGGGTTNFLRADGSWAPAGGGGLTVGTTTITGGASGDVEYNNAGVLGEMTTSGTGTQLALTASPSFSGTIGGSPAASGSWTFSAAGAASVSPVNFTGAPFTGGNATTNTPLVYLNGSMTAPTTWSTSGTVFGINAPGSFGGELIDLHVGGGGRLFSVAATGAVSGIGDFLSSATGSNSAPNIAALNANTGMYSTVSGSNLAFSVGSAPELDFGITNGGKWTSDASFIVGVAGSVSSVNLAADTSNTGMYSTSGANLGFSVGGVVKLDYAITHGGDLTSAVPVISGVAGSFSQVNFGAEAINNGMYAPSTTTLGFSAGGTLVLDYGITTANVLTLPSAVTISNAAFLLPSIITDTAIADATLCRASTGGRVYFGSGTLGICLGTSSERYKHRIENLIPGLDAILKLKPKSFYMNEGHGDPKKQMYGFIAEDMVRVLPKLVGFDKEGRPNTADYLGVVPVLVKAVQEQQREIENLKHSHLTNACKHLWINNLVCW